jgi:hypothetical protein
MTSQYNPAPDVWALLIGIDCYLPNQFPDGIFYRSLSGCVRDILQTEQFLRGTFGLTDERVIRLTASKGNDEKPAEPLEQWPTYQNIRKAFRKLQEDARPGEQVYIHYSGHGGRVKTLPEHREVIPYKRVDEALVPTDIAGDEGRYLRDIELAFMIQKLVDKELYVTIVLDSCHSGSATRIYPSGATRVEEIVSDEVTLRGSGEVMNLPKPSLVASDEELTQNWLRVAKPVGRDFYVRSDWLPDPQGYVLLAACAAHEGAHEHCFDGENKQGALTYCLLEAFKKFGDGATYRVLHRYIHAKVSELFRGTKYPQNPQLEGEGDRLVFGQEPVEVPYAFVIRNVDEASGKVTLSAGRVHGLGAGARFAFYSSEQINFKRSDTPLAIAEITERGITSSTARIVDGSLQGQVRQGDGAVLLAPGTDTPRYTVKVLGPQNTTPDPALAVAIDQLVTLLRRQNEGYVQLLQQDEAVDFLITISSTGQYCICDSSGTEIPNVKPALSVTDPDAAPHLVERLIHLAKYRGVRELKNFDPLSPLSQKFSVELLGFQANYKPRTQIHPRPFAETQGTPSVGLGNWIFFCAHNHYKPREEEITLYVTVFDLQPDWSIRQVFPSRAGWFETVEPGDDLIVPLYSGLPDNYNEGIDLIKFFVTVEPADFHFFELPPSDKSSAQNRPTRGYTLRSHVPRSVDHAGGESQVSEMAVPIHRGEDWSTRQFEIKVRR